MQATRTARLVAAALVVLGLAAPASAQTQMFGLGVEGDIEAGVRLYGDRPSDRESAKFEEYRDLPQLPYLERFHLRLFRPDESYSFEFDGSKWGQQDQEFSLRTGRLGLWEFGFDWDQLRHIFSTNARMLARETSRGVFTLPVPRPTNAQGNVYNTARELDEISTRWDTSQIFFRLTPTPDLELKTTYTRINKDGDRPMGVPFGFNFIEVLEPIEQTIHDMRLQATIAREQWQLQFSYTFSLFENSVSSLTADNPSVAADTAAASAAGRMSLPPDNTAHTFSLAGGVNLPWWRTRVTSNFSYSLRLQNDDFLPHTRNPLVFNAAPVDLALPQSGLNGNVQIFLYNLNVTSRPLPPLTLSLKYRLYDYKDKSDVIAFPAIVETDSTIVAEVRRPGRWSYRKQNGDVDARWRIIQPVALTLGAGWERWDRNEHREVPESDEFFGKAVLDLTPFDWLLVRAKYVPSFRRINLYNTHAHIEHTVLEDAAALSQGQTALLRKFDQGERDRQRLDLLLQFTPTDTLTITPTAGDRHDHVRLRRFRVDLQQHGHRRDLPRRFQGHADPESARLVRHRQLLVRPRHGSYAEPRIAGERDRRPTDRRHGTALSGVRGQPHGGGNRAQIPLLEELDGKGWLYFRGLREARLADGYAQPLHPRRDAWRDLAWQRPEELRCPHRRPDARLPLQVGTPHVVSPRVSHLQDTLALLTLFLVL